MAAAEFSGEREVVLVGIGAFGARTVGLFRNILAERRHQLPPGSLGRVAVHDVLLDTRGGPFRFTEMSRAITERVRDSRARKFSGRFSYIFVGDLSDDGTATYGVDYAYLPWVIEQTGTLRKDEVLGFFTFSDELGASIPCSAEKMAGILGFFSRLDKIDRENTYVPPYTDANGRPFAPVDSPNGPFERNYVVVTPGGQDAVMDETSQVFAERIFYELFYLADEYKSLASSLQARRSEADGNCLCTFSMIEISRLSELQRYFLAYTLEDKVTDCLLADSMAGTDVEFFRRKFFEMMDVPESDEFPLGRAADLFVSRHRSALSGVLAPYVRRSPGDFSDYVSECRARIERRALDLAPKIEEFVRAEMDGFLAVLTRGFTSLFRIDRFTGNIGAYVAFISLLRDRLARWEESLVRLSEAGDEVSLDGRYADVENRVRRLQDSLLYRLPPFVPLRRRLIEGAILSLPVEEFFRSRIRRDIARSVLSWWRSSSPVAECDSLVHDLSLMKVALAEKKAQIRQKMAFLSSVPKFYYIISQEPQAAYSALLDRVGSRNFGAARKSALEAAARDVFKEWTANRDLQGISKDAAGFVSFVDRCVAEKCAASFGAVEEDADAFARYAAESVGQMRRRSEQLAEKSFHTQNSTAYLAEKRILLNPASDRLDPLGEQLRDGDDGTESLEIPNEFTLGSVVFFRDYLYLGMNSLQKIDGLRKYAGERARDGSFAAARADSGVSDDELSFAEKCVRAVLLDFCPEERRLSFYRGAFGVSASPLDSGRVNALAKAIPLEDVLSTLSAEQLEAFAKDVGAQTSADRARQVRLISRAVASR